MEIVPLYFLICSTVQYFAQWHTELSNLSREFVQILLYPIDTFQVALYACRPDLLCGLGSKLYTFTEFAAFDKGLCS
jgi:hypothetical protein